MATANKPTDNIMLLPYRDRVAMIRERLNSLRHACKVEALPKSAKVAAAFAIVGDWERRDEAHREAQRKAHRRLLNQVQDAFLLGDTAKAVELLNKIEANT